MDQVSRLAPWYVTGLIEAQGSFVCAPSSRSVEVSFELALPGRDQPLLAQLRASLGGVGRLHRRSATGPAVWRITRRLELLRLVEHLEAFPLQGARTAAFAPWAALVRRRAASFRRPLPPEAWDLAEQVRSAQPRRRGRHARRSQGKSDAAVDERPGGP
jgi:LAGLIDADG DNA endonuclease family protein